MRYFMFLFLLSATLISTAQTIEGFSLENVRSGEKVSLADYKDKKAIVVIFTSNVCPYAVYYEGRITQLIADFKQNDIQFLLINAHTEDKESTEEMANKIKTWGLKVPYLADKQQIAKKMLDARKSPEAFVLKPKNGGFEIFYDGAIDNNPQVASDVKHRYLRNNIKAAIEGRVAEKGGNPIGCMIR
ncbi:MAG: redoxin domain-containing protein [Fulvivirga sp.]|nr:redoxin domain-containing protein [Fulvivirga sp.]